MLCLDQLIKEQKAKDKQNILFFKIRQVTPKGFYSLS